MMKASRIVCGGGITHPFGRPQLPHGEERQWRQGLVEKALDALTRAADEGAGVPEE
jgi:hypothetical protein